MAEPEIRYVRAADGVTIACYEMGEGVPFVMMDMPYSHLLSEWRLDEAEGLNLRGSSGMARLVRYDHRGFGLSEREAPDLSLDAFVSDLEAVVDKLDLPPFFLYAGRGPTTPIAVSFVARHPDRVRRLVLYHAAVRMPPKMHEQLGALLALPTADWRFISESVSRLVQGWEDNESSQRLAGLLRDSIDLAGFRRWFEAYASWDAEGLLPIVSTPTLLTCFRDHEWFGPELARPVAAAMPDARVFVSDGATSRERAAQTIAAVSAFLGAPPPDVALEEATRTSTAGTAVILFTDIADSTALTERMGDAGFRDASRALDAGLRTAIRGAGGEAIDGKLLGDGVLATFPSAAQAIDGARRCLALSAASELGLHIGLHAGDVIREENNVYGGAVNIASRICGLSAPGEILVSDVVRGMARSSAGVEFEDRGEQEMKGVGEPVRVYAVRWQEEA